MMALALPSPAVAQLLDQTAYIERCATRDTATAWLRIVNDWRNERPGGWSHDSLRTVLLALAETDRRARPEGWRDSLMRPEFSLRMTRHENATANAMREIVRRFGWPTRSMVGVAGSLAALRIASSTTSIQADAIRRMWALPADEVPRFEVAALEDRFHVARNEPQRYATHVRETATGVQFYPVDTIARIGARRADAALPPMPVYQCIIRASSGADVSYPPPEFTIDAPTGKLKSYWKPHLRANGGVPQIASIAVGGMYVRWRAPDASRWNGFLFIAEPGVRAAKAHFGYGSSDLRASGISGTLVFLNYWDDGDWHEPWDKYAGLEFQVSLRHVDLGVGQYQSLRAGKLRLAASLGYAVW
jgi:hypothetical protein